MIKTQSKVATRRMILILNFLEGRDWVSTSRLARSLTINNYEIQNTLNDLLKNKDIQKKEKGTFVYWRLKKK